MAEAISIPSPSVFLRTTTPPSPATAEAQAAKNARKQSDQTKRKATRKSNVNASASDRTVAKPKQSKSRNGCITCKAKRLKCGEEKPGCQQCARRSVECGGYKKDFKWRPFEETNVKINIDRLNRVSPPRQTSAQSSSPISPSKISAESTSGGLESSRDQRKDGKRRNSNDEDLTTTELPARPAKAKRKQRVVDDANRGTDSPTETRQEEVVAQADDEDVLSAIASDTISPQELHHLALPSTGLSPTFSEISMSFPEDQTTAPSQDFIAFDMPEDMQYPVTPLPVSCPDLAENELINDEIDEVVLTDLLPVTTPLFLDTNLDAPDSSLPPISAEDALLGPWDGPISYLYSQPYFAQDSAEMLSFRFDRLTCGILSVMDGPNENPWRSLIWPLAQQSPALYHAVMAMTSFHSSTDVPSLRIVGHEHKQASIRYIQEGIRDNSMTDQTAIATALALGFSESWDQHTASGNTHIKGAQALVKRALVNHQHDPLGDVELARLKFLCNAWVYMDVIARLTSVDSDQSHDFDNTLLFAIDSPQMVYGDVGHPGFGIDFGMPIDARLDPLMGCANTLFPLIGRVANLVRKVCRSQTNSPAVISQANDLKLALETWDPPAFIERPEDVTTDVQHTLQTAEAYRWATLLHLHQSVPELPSLSSAELAQRVLQYLATVPLASRTVIVQIYPLMVAGCGAVNEEDRQWVRDRWTAMGQRMRIGVIDKSAAVTEEVWRRIDAYEAQPTTRRKLVATSELNPARQRGTPLVRTSTGARNADPGRTGMVFSYVESNDEVGKSGPNERWPARRNVPDRAMGAMDPAYTVRGHLHWVGVMWDWGWEVLLG